jgi:hypothetical protein
MVLCIECTGLTWHYPVLAPFNKNFQLETCRRVCKRNLFLCAAGGLVEQSCQRRVWIEDMQHVIFGKSRCKLHLLICKINWLFFSVKINWLIGSIGQHETASDMAQFWKCTISILRTFNKSRLIINSTGPYHFFFKAR